MPCDTTLCPSVKRSSSVYLWRAALNNVSLCYSYENCGSVDTDHSQQLACLAECEKTKQHHECLCECQNHGCNVCGDGKLDKGHSVEGCDDGNTEDGDGCDGVCTIEEGYTCTAEEDQLSKCTTKSGQTIPVEDRCECTGNQGYYKSEAGIFDGKEREAYDYGSGYGQTCAVHDIEYHDPNDPETHWMSQAWYDS